MERLAGIVIGLLVLSLVFWLVESLFAARPDQPRPHRRRGFETDLIHWFATPLVTRSVTQIGLALILVATYRQDIGEIQAMLASRDDWITRQPQWLEAIGMLLVGDLFGYWIHRAFQSRRLWAFHAIHHSSKDLDWLSAARLHPVNAWLARWLQATALVLLGFSPLAVACVPFLTLYGILLHANVSWGFGPLGSLIASPRFHRWHHTAERDGLNKDFAGLFPVWDRLFGTYFMPRDRQPERFGIERGNVPESYLGQMAYPFRRQA